MAGIGLRWGADLAQSGSIGATRRPRTAIDALPADARLGALGDSDLLALLSRGDHEALGAIYDRHINALWKVALHYSATFAAAEDAVTAAFLRLFRRPISGDSSSLSASLRATVTRESRSAAAGAQASRRRPRKRSRRFSLGRRAEANAARDRDSSS